MTREAQAVVVESETISLRGMPPTRRSHRRNQRFATVALYIPLVVWAAISLYPFAFLILVSFRSISDVYTRPFGLPSVWHLENYSTAWHVANMATLALNSIGVSVGATILVLVISAPAAYALSRFNFRLKPLVWGYLLFGLFVPDVTRLVPIVIVVQRLHLYNSLVGLTLVYTATGIPFTIFLLAAFMKSLPVEIEEAARVDGAKMVRVFVTVVLPLSRAALITAATFQFLNSWNEFIVARLLLETHVTLPVGMAEIVGEFGANYTSFAAATVMATIPAILVFIILQRHVITGLAEGAVRA